VPANTTLAPAITAATDPGVAFIIKRYWKMAVEMKAEELIRAAEDPLDSF
jgi:hypothetical protein